jgi:DNA polymerase-3 subunit alpha
MNQKFTHLHVHSHYSLLDGLPKIDEILDYCQKLGMDSVALTDHGALYGAVEFYKKAKERKIKPIIGAELYLAIESRFQERPGIDDKRYHIVLLVKNETGYKNLVKLITKSHLEGFYYKPRIDEELLAQYSEGLICLSACLQGKIPQLILAKKIDEVERIIQKYQEIFGKENFYLEIQHHPNLKEQKIVNEALIEFSKKLKIPLVATNDCHYLKPGDAEAQDILMLINTGADPNDPERLTMKADDFSMRPPQKMTEDFENVPEAIENTQRIVEACNFEFKLGKIKMPRFETPNGKSPEEYLEELCYEGLRKRYGEKVEQKVLDRLKYELDVIKKTGFASYFLIVQDFVNWAKSQRIVVGPGRGSAGGSLVAYVLGITEIDPLKHDLLWERFLNPERVSPPDIDLDFTDVRRDEVIEYLTQKYGRDRVAQIITFGTMAARAVIRDVGRALGYPYSYCDRIAKLIPAGLSLDESLARVLELRQIYESEEKAQKLIDFAKKLEGCARHVSTHACGVVISTNSLDEICPLQHPTQDDEAIVTQYEMRSLEDLGLLKIDVLGLKNLTLIEETLKKIYAIHKKEIKIEQIPFNDKKTYKLFQRGETIGVFQFESEGMRKWLRKLKPNCFDDLVALIALYRPGPMQFLQDYIDGKFKRKRIEYLHPKLKPILEKTYGVCIYQEQLMQIARDLAGFSLAEADVLRKAVGKKIKSLLEGQRDKLIQGMIKNGIQKEVAQKIWEWILPFASYGFNKSHSVAYAKIAFYTAFLKTYFPVEFMASLLTSEQSDVEKIGFLIEECKRMGIEVLPPDINESFRNFSVVPGKNQIRFGLLAIKNVGQNTVEAIVEERKRGGPFKSLSDFLSRIGPKDLNKKSLESMIKAGVFDKFEERNQLLFNLERLFQFNRESQNLRAEGQIGLFEKLGTKKTEIKLEKTKPASKKEKLIWEKELLGLYVSSHPAEDFKSIFEKKAFPISKISSQMAGKMIKIGGIISAIKKVITRNGSPMIFAKLEDGQGKIEAVIFPSTLMKNPQAIKEHKAVLISGRVNNKDGVPKVICEDIEEIIES